MNSIYLNSFSAKIKIAFVFLFLFSLQSNAQRVAVNININSHPSSDREYERHDDYEDAGYYYYPEIETYFDVRSSVYIYFDHGNWVRSRYLPRYCSDYDVYRGYKVVIDYHGRSPYTHFHTHKKRYNSKQYSSCCEKKYKHECHGKHKKHKKKHHDHDDD